MPHQAIVAINGANYVLKPFYVDAGPDPTDPTGKRRLRHRYVLRHYAYQQEAETQAQLGQSSVDTRTGIRPVKFYPPKYGMGRRRILSGQATPRDFYRFWRSHDVNTIHPRQATLGLQNQDSTEESADNQIFVASINHKNALLALHYRTTNVIYVTKYDGATTTWDSGAVVVSGGATFRTANDIIEHKGVALAATCNGNDHEVYISTDGGANWAAPSTTQIAANLLADNVTVGEVIDAILLATVGNEAIAVVWHEANGTITFYSSADNGNTWADEAIDIASGNGPQGVAVMRGPDGVTYLYVGTREGIYEVDVTPATWTFNMVFPAPAPHNDNFRRMAVGSVPGTKRAGIWFGLGTDNNSAGDVGVLVTAETGYDVYINSIPDGEDSIFLGPAAGDGCDSTLYGPARWWVAAGQYMFAAFGGGAASRNAWIMCHNGLGPHIFYTHSTANQKMTPIMLSPEDNGVPRLHFVMVTSATAFDSQFLANPLTSPTDGQTYNYEADGYLEPPEYNLDAGDVTKTYINVHEDAEDLSATTAGDYINVDYGLTGAAANTTDLGDFLSGTLSIDFGSGAGVAGRSIQVRENFIRDAGSTADTPKRRILTIRQKAKYTTLNGYEFEVNVPATAAYNHDPNNLKAVIDALETARDSTTMVTFQYSPIASTYVEVMLDESQEDIQSEVTTDTVTADRPVVAVRVRAEER